MDVPSIILENLYTEELYRIPSKVIVVLPSPWESVSPEAQLLLTKILNSVQLTMASVQIVVYNSFSIDDFKAYSPAMIVAFGAIPKSSSKMYEVVTIEGISFINADSLDILNDVTKKNLWLALKQLFLA
jgi:hypothetical protein